MIVLKKGDKAPSFIGIDQNGNTHRLTDYLGKKIVLFFYPKADTPGCTAEACNLRDYYTLFKEKNYEILGISADNQTAQSKFKDKYLIPFSLLTDESKKIISDYGVWGTKKFMGKEYKGILRTTFIIDEKGIIEDIIIKVKTKDHTSQILK